MGAVSEKIFPDWKLQFGHMTIVLKVGKFKNSDRGEDSIDWHKLSEPCRNSLARSGGRR